MDKGSPWQENREVRSTNGMVPKIMSSPRITLVLPVRFSFDVHAIQTTSQELSTDGALVRCLEPPPLGTHVKLRF